MIAELRNISRDYPLPGSATVNRVLDTISLIVPATTAIAVTGPSGSGKSTLLNLLGTLDLPTSGEVLLDGRSTATMDENTVADFRNHYTGFIFQMHYLLPQLTLIENILLPTLPIKDRSLKKKALERADELMHILGIAAIKYQFPSASSVGECQRAAVVRALINEPRLLLADEPTGSLDQTNAEILAGLLMELKSRLGFSMVVVTHSQELAAKMDKQYRLSSGKLVDILK